MSTDRPAGSTLNSNGGGQVLYGLVYDVRDSAPGAAEIDPQQVNIQIANQRFPGPATGGVLARVRLRESKTSQEVLSFDVAIACGQVWTGVVFLDGTGGSALPAIRAAQPIVSDVDDTTVTTEPLLDPANGGAAQPFAIPPGLTAADVQRGYIEVISEERLPCEPEEAGGVSLDGNIYARLGGSTATALNTLAGEVFLIRPLANLALEYKMTAISRFVIEGGGSIWSPPESGLPDVGSCIGFNARTEDEYTGFPDCLNQLDFALSKSRLYLRFEIDPATGGQTFAVVTLPTKGDHCTPGEDAASPPFRCEPAGEAVSCRVVDQLGNELDDTPDCVLPREMSILQIGNPSARSPLADAVIDVGSLTSGQIVIDLVGDPPEVHEHVGLSPDLIDLLGIGQRGFRGLPALSLVVQEVTTQGDGADATAVEASSEVELLPGPGAPRAIGRPR